MRPGPPPRLSFLWLLLLLWLPQGTSAQDGERSLTAFVPVQGSLEPGGRDVWSFTAPVGSMISLRASELSGGMDPQLKVYDLGGALLAANDDVDWPANRDAVIEALGIPASGTYEVHVSPVGMSGGTYELALLQGWSRLFHDEDFSDAGAWQADSGAADTWLGEGRAVLLLEPPVTSLTLTRELELPPADFAMHADVTGVAGNRGWQLGLVSHWQDRSNWARYTVNDRGQWNFLVHTPEGLRVLRAWTTHPAIHAGEEPASLGLVNYGDAIELFYNGRSLGRITEGIPTTPGRPGIHAGAGDESGGQVTAWFSGLKLTMPAQTADGALVPMILPGADRATILRNLQRHNLLPARGETFLQVPESFVVASRAGVSTLRLGGESRFGRFVLGTTFVPEPATVGRESGCGLYLEADAPEHYTLAWLDNAGVAGLSRRSGDSFAPGPVRGDVARARGPHQLIIVADGTRLLYFADNHFVGELPASVTAGSVGNAALGFRSLTTTCHFSDTWLWRPDED